MILTFTACYTGSAIKNIANDEYSLKNKAIPPEFGFKNTILLCVKYDKKYNRILEKEFSENYNGQYLLLDRDSINSSSYLDTYKYRYMFDHSYGGINNKKCLYIYDRQKDKFYKSGGCFKVYDNAMEAYVKNLEEVRLKNN